jgi:hypothetical protein
MAISKPPIPEVLPTSPMSLDCPFCEAKIGVDCAASSGGFSVVHIARVRAAAKIDRRKQNARRKRHGS